MEFKTPAFLLNHSTNEIHEKMRAILPADIDMSEGGHTWNFTRPTALIVSELCEFILPEVIKLIFPDYSYDEFLLYHAKVRNMNRREATAATGEITITGTPDAFIPKGSIFSTPIVDEDPSVDYETLEGVKIPSTGTVTVPIKCTQTGIAGNTTSNTIILNTSKIKGITAVTNEADVTGGTETESDESLIARISEYDRTQGDSFVGSAADYKRWAESVDGVGRATVIPAQDDSGLVTIMVADANGLPATEKLCEDVYNYIMVNGNAGDRFAPVNALLSVVPPSTITIAVKATVELAEDATIESVKSAYIAQLTSYLPQAMGEKEIKYTKIHAALSATPGVNDFSDLQIGIKGESYGTGNIQISTSILAGISEDDIELVSGTV